MTDAPGYTGIQHVSMLVADISRSLLFYHDTLQLPVVPDRPDLPYAGAWLQIGPQQIHLLELPNPDPTEDRPAHGGHDRHTAIVLSNLSLLEARLMHAGIAYTRSSSGREALFCRDPDGNALEFIQQPGC